MVVLELMSLHHGLHAQPLVELVFSLELFPTLVLTCLDSKLKHVQHHLVSMAHGPPGHLAQLHVVVVSNNVAVIIIAVKHHTSKNAPALSQLVHGVLGLSGPSVLYHVAVPVFTALDSIRALVKWTLTLSSVTLIHVLITVPGLTGLHVLLHVVLEQ